MAEDRWSTEAVKGSAPAKSRTRAAYPRIDFRAIREGLGIHDLFQPHQDTDQGHAIAIQQDTKRKFPVPMDAGTAIQHQPSLLCDKCVQRAEQLTRGRGDFNVLITAIVDLLEERRGNKERIRELEEEMGRLREGGGAVTP